MSRTDQSLSPISGQCLLQDNDRHRAGQDPMSQQQKNEEPQVDEGASSNEVLLKAIISEPGGVPMEAQKDFQAHGHDQADVQMLFLERDGPPTAKVPLGERTILRSTGEAVAVSLAKYRRVTRSQARDRREQGAESSKRLVMRKDDAQYEIKRLQDLVAEKQDAYDELLVRRELFLEICAETKDELEDSQAKAERLKVINRQLRANAITLKENCAKYEAWGDGLVVKAKEAEATAEDQLRSVTAFAEEQIALVESLRHSKDVLHARVEAAKLEIETLRGEQGEALRRDEKARRAVLLDEQRRSEITRSNILVTGSIMVGSAVVFGLHCLWKAFLC